LSPAPSVSLSLSRISNLFSSVFLFCFFVLSDWAKEEEEEKKVVAKWV
jgi:hypothetical protein